MSAHHRPASQKVHSIFTLMPGEFVRFEYTYKPGCFWFASKTTTVTNMRLITRVIKPAPFFSKRTGTGKEYGTMIFLADIHDIKQLRSAIPSSDTRWWVKCLQLLTCSCDDQQIDWLESCRDGELCLIEKF